MVSIFNKRAYSYDINNVIRVKKVRRLEFETQRCKVQNSTMPIESNRVCLEFKTKQIWKKCALILEPNNFFRNQIKELCGQHKN